MDSATQMGIMGQVMLLEGTSCRTSSASGYDRMTAAVEDARRGHLDGRDARPAVQRMKPWAAMQLSRSNSCPR
jgi:hypothetical protein